MRAGDKEVSNAKQRHTVENCVVCVIVHVSIMQKIVERHSIARSVTGIRCIRRMEDSLEHFGLEKNLFPLSGIELHYLGLLMCTT
jgi:hypothetical protein